jgi:hypothetical protein
MYIVFEPLTGIMRGDPISSNSQSGAQMTAAYSAMASSYMNMLDISTLPKADSGLRDQEPDQELDREVDAFGLGDKEPHQEVDDSDK